MKSLAASSQPNAYSPLPASFFLQDTLAVARKLIGKGLRVQKGQAPAVIVEILEVEAYLGDKDPASHAFRGKTNRNWPMFEAGGTCYVYLSYGCHYCMNVTTRESGQGEAVLLRAASVVSGAEIVLQRRSAKSGKLLPEKDWLNGPGKLTVGLGVDLQDNGRVFDKPDFKMVDLGRSYTSNQIGESPRIGISKRSMRLSDSSLRIPCGCLEEDRCTQTRR